MAVVTPILMLMLIGIMEFGWAFMVSESLTNATREACRLGILAGVTETEIRDRFVEAMDSTGVDVTTEMVTVQEATEENPVVTVSASIPYSEVSITGATAFLGFTKDSIGSVCSMRKEGM